MRAELSALADPSRVDDSRVRILFRETGDDAVIFLGRKRARVQKTPFSQDEESSRQKRPLPDRQVSHASLAPLSEMDRGREDVPLRGAGRVEQHSVVRVGLEPRQRAASRPVTDTRASDSPLRCSSRTERSRERRSRRKLT